MSGDRFSLRSAQAFSVSKFPLTRVFGVASSESQKITPEQMRGSEVFHYSIPNVQKFGTGLIEDGASIASDKLQIDRSCVLISKLNPRKSTVCIADRHEITTVASSEFVPISSGDAGDDKYLFWVLSSSVVASYLNSLVNSATRSHQRVQPREILGMSIPWPRTEVRRSIVRFLDRETTEIDAMLGKLDELAGVFRQRPALTAAVFGLKGGRTLTDRPQSPLAGIPEHWKRTKFGYDFTESTERNGANPIGPLLSISEYRGIEVNRRTDGQQASLDVSKYRVVRPGQLAANMMWLNHGGLGVSSHAGYVSPDYKTFWISERFDPRYVHYLFRSPRYVGYFAAIATGVRPNAQRVIKTVLDATPVPVPPIDEQRWIADRLDEVTTNVDAMLAKVAELRSLLIERRAALITDVVTGTKRIA